MTIRLEIAGRVARILIDRAPKRNAMTHAMWAALPALVAEADAAPAVRVIVLQSAVAGVFCAGADIAELLANRHDAGWRAANQAAINAAQSVLTRAARPTIAFIDGDCVGGGCGLALACDIRISTSRSRIGITPARLGLIYPLHDVKLLVDLVGPGQARRMLFTGNLLDAEEACRIGLVDKMGASPDRMVEQIAANSPASCAGIKAFVRRVLDGQVADDADTLARFAAAFDGADFAEGVSAFVAKRKPEFGP